MQKNLVVLLISEEMQNENYIVKNILAWLRTFHIFVFCFLTITALCNRNIDPLEQV